MIGKKVKHTMWGTGIITAYDGAYITVEFATKTTKFQFPDAFEKFIKAEDPGVQESIIKSIQEAKHAAEQKRLAEEATRKEAEERRAAEEASRRTAIGNRPARAPQPVARAQRLPGRQMVFFVFQGDTFEKEYRGGYIWAPLATKAGTTPHHWTRLLDVREGDIILHGCNGYVKAISVARGSCYDCQQPAELAVEELWERDGRRIDCNYVPVANPIKTSDFIPDILRHRNAKYSPFDRDGRGNMGYLCEINKELARTFIKATAARNPHIMAADFIDEFLSYKEFSQNKE